MLYPDFGKTLELRLGTRADLYPHATEYHRRSSSVKWVPSLIRSR